MDFTEEGFGEHQRSFGAGDEVRQVLPGLQADPQVAASGQVQADHHRQQHSSPKVRDYWEVAFAHKPNWICRIHMELRIRATEKYGNPLGK